MNEDNFVGIKGNIRDKVAYLQVSSTYLKVIESPLNVEYLELAYSYIHPDSLNIEATDMSVEAYYNSDIITNNLGKIHVKQYGIFYYDKVINDLLITYKNNNHWNLQWCDDYNGIEYNLDIPYSIAKKLMVNSIFDTVYLNVESGTVAKDINITYTNPLFTYFLSISDLYNQNAKFVTEGEWDSITKADVYFNTFHKKINLITDSCNEKVNIIKGLPYNLPEDVPFEITKPKQQIMSSASFIISTLSPTECEDYAAFCEQNSKECPYEIGIKKMYCTEPDKIGDSLELVEEDSDGVIIALDELYSYQNDVKIDFDKLKYAKPVYIVDNELSENILKKKKENEIDANLMKKKNKRTRTNDIYVVIKGDIKNKVSYLYTNYINLHITESPLNVDKLELYQTVIKKESEKIISPQMVIDIDSFSYTFVENECDTTKLINVKDLILNDCGLFNLGYYRYMIKFGETSLQMYNFDISTQIFYSDDGYHIDIPYSICDNLSFIAVSHFFDFSLIENDISYIKPINITLLKYKNPANSIISEIKEARLLDDDKKFLVKFTTFGNWNDTTATLPIQLTSHLDLIEVEKKVNSNVDIINYIINEDGSVKPEIVETPDGGDDDDNNNNNKKKLSAGQIAGIVIGCIAGVAIIAAVVVIVVIKMKKKSNSSAENQNDNNEL